MNTAALRAANAAPAIAAFCRAGIQGDCETAAEDYAQSFVQEDIRRRSDALDDLVDHLEATADDGDPFVDEVAIRSLCLLANVWRYRLPDGVQHPDYRAEWAPAVSTR